MWIGILYPCASWANIGLHGVGLAQAVPCPYLIFEAMTAPVGRSRWDALACHAYSRGSRSSACAIASDAHTLAFEVDALHDAEYARTTRGPHASRLKTVEILGRSIGLAYPLTVDMLYEVAASLRGAGYRSAFSYVTRSVQEHRARD